MTSMLMHFPCTFIDAMHLCTYELNQHYAHDIGYTGVHLVWFIDYKRGIKSRDEKCLACICEHIFFANLSAWENEDVKKKYTVSV